MSLFSSWLLEVAGAEKMALRCLFLVIVNQKCLRPFAFIQL